jgi:hypothetical protein
MNKDCQALAVPIPEINEFQRKCVAHLLRNCDSAIEGLVEFVEDRERPIAAHELHDCLKGVHRVIDRLVMATLRGSFCSLNEEDCEFVKRFSGCSGIPEK